MEGFLFNGTWITDPSMDETGRFPVDPVEYYGVNLDYIVVKEYKGVAYFKDRKDAEAHMKKFAPKGRVIEYVRGYAVQTKISGPYLNKSGKGDDE